MSSILPSVEVKGAFPKTIAGSSVKLPDQLRGTGISAYNEIQYDDFHQVQTKVPLVQTTGGTSLVQQLNFYDISDKKVWKYPTKGQMKTFDSYTEVRVQTRYMDSANPNVKILLRDQYSPFHDVSTYVENQETTDTIRYYKEGECVRYHKLLRALSYTYESAFEASKKFGHGCWDCLNALSIPADATSNPTGLLPRAYWKVLADGTKQLTYDYKINLYHMMMLTKKFRQDDSMINLETFQTLRTAVMFNTIKKGFTYPNFVNAGNTIQIDTSKIEVIITLTPKINYFLLEAPHPIAVNRYMPSSTKITRIWSIEEKTSGTSDTKIIKTHSIKIPSVDFILVQLVLNTSLVDNTLKEQWLDKNVWSQYLTDFVLKIDGDEIDCLHRRQTFSREEFMINLDKITGCEDKREYPLLNYFSDMYDGNGMPQVSKDGKYFMIIPLSIITTALSGYIGDTPQKTFDWEINFNAAINATCVMSYFWTDVLTIDNQSGMLSLNSNDYKN